MPQRLRDWLAEPCDPASLGVFRAVLGCVLVISVTRFFVYGWIDLYFHAPEFFFTYDGLSWIRPWPRPWMHVHYAMMGLAAVAFSFGWHTRAAAAVFGLLFSYAELIDKTNYLNHYYFISLVMLLFAVLPSGGAFSLGRARPVPRLSLLAFRAQVAAVYIFAGIAKLEADWLLRAEPLKTWLRARTETFLLGPLFAYDATAFVMSWAGALFDLFVVGFLLWRRTRGLAFTAVVLFHLTTRLLFDIGLFPWVMIAGATLLFDPAWPRRLGFAGEVSDTTRATTGATKTDAAMMPGRLVQLGLVALVVLQLVLPLRHWVTPGSVLWAEEGFRFSWRVMLVEKPADVQFIVTSASGRREVVEPSDHLTPLQVKMMAQQPDMIEQFARYLGRLQHEKTGEEVRVFADAWVSFNGRPKQRYLRPDVDLLRHGRGEWMAPRD